MTSPVVSGIIENILAAVNGEGGTVYSSGQVQVLIFKDLNLLNALMAGPCFSGDNIQGVISPEISGTIFQGILELMVSKDLTQKSLFAASRTGSLVEFAEGDSKVKMSDSAKTLAELYKSLNDQFNYMVNQAKYTLVSNSPSSIIGTDAGINVNAGYLGYPQNYYPRQG